MSAATTKEKPSALRSIIAGATAGAIEIAVTYPAEFAKVRTQLNKRLPDGQKLPWPPFGRQWYTGCTTNIAGNSFKAAVRFLAFDTFKSLLSDENGNISGPRTVLAGLGAGVSESVLAVTPSESVKVKLIDDKKSPNPRMRGLVHGTSVILREQGVRALFNGLLPTTVRQASSSAVRFGSYMTMKQLAQSYIPPGEKLGSAATFGIGAMAGTITVYVTMPIDVVKSRMQSLHASQYRNSVECFYRIATEEGIRALWSGAVPRLARLMMSGGIVFTLYEKSMEFFNWVDPGKKYI
ncbi:hypothetical protein TWF730_009502 [Orbilia blumenaviensis]|uniref:Uncharacterized protein n=1 Tax=Orbilia blumenaviensis TaxID=1796055 RepID=A0AAV9V1Q6_9PEZI